MFGLNTAKWAKFDSGVSWQLDIYVAYAYNYTKLKILEYIRRKFQPLWRIRRTKCLHKFFSLIAFKYGFRDKYTGFKIFIYWYRDLPFLLSNNYIFEKEVRRAIILFAKLKNISKFWDVGANIGDYSFLISDLMPKSEITAFEPLKKILMYLLVQLITIK